MKKINYKRTTKSLAYIALFSALTAVSAFMKIPAVVPFTLQTMACMLAGLFLSRRDAVFSQLIYIILGLVGVPIFTKGGGFSYVLEPTFGYLLFLPVCAYLINLFYEKGLKAIWACLIASICLLVFGTVYFALIMEFYLGKAVVLDKIFISCCVTFIPAELSKAFLAHMLFERLKKVIKTDD